MITQTKYDVDDTVFIRAKITEIQISEEYATEYTIAADFWRGWSRCTEEDIICKGDLKDISCTETMKLPCKTRKTAYILDELGKIHRAKVRNEIKIYSRRPYIKCEVKNMDIYICDEDIGSRVFWSLPAVVSTLIKKEIKRLKD